MAGTVISFSRRYHHRRQLPFFCFNKRNGLDQLLLDGRKIPIYRIYCPIVEMSYGKFLGKSNSLFKLPAMHKIVLKSMKHLFRMFTYNHNNINIWTDYWFRNSFETSVIQYLTMNKYENFWRKNENKIIFYRICIDPCTGKSQSDNQYLK